MGGLITSVPSDYDSSLSGFLALYIIYRELFSNISKNLKLRVLTFHIHIINHI
jgi:hypothetical protein